jgi:hypothetical protein
MANDLEGRGDKLSEAVGVLGERVARVEHGPPLANGRK